MLSAVAFESRSGAVCESGSVLLGQARTPIGAFGALFSPAGLSRLTFPSEPQSRCEAWARRWMPGSVAACDPRILAALSEQLTAYLEGTLWEFSTPLDLRGTLFQMRVWGALLEIGYGEVRDYRSIAAAIGRPGAVRAVGRANGSNPVPIIVPCHRVIGSDGTLTGYGGGLDIKERLLRLEGGRFSAAPDRRNIAHRGPS